MLAALALAASIQAPSSPATEPGTPRKAGAFRVEVCRAWQGKPVAGAEIRFAPLDEERFPGRTVVPPDEYEVLVRDELFRDGPALAFTDAGGIATLAGLPGPGFLCVQAGIERGTELVHPPDERDGRVVVFPDWPVDVLVVDPAGKPLDGLSACMRYASRSGGELRFHDATATAVPLGGGRVRLEHAGFLQGRIGYDRRFFVGISGWLGAPVHEPLPSAAAPEGPITIVLPPSTALELVVTDGGAVDVAPRGAWIGLPGYAGALDDRRHAIHLRAPEAGGLSRMLADGRATFDHVALGAELLAVTWRGPRSAPSSVRVRAPETSDAAGGERARVELPLGAGGVTLRGRVLRPDGAPCREHDLVFGFAAEGRAPSDRECRWLETDEQGRFALDFDLAHRGGDPGVLALVWRAGWESFLPGDPRIAVRARYPHPLRAEVALAGLWSAGAHDLGDLVLAEVPCFAAGTVVDARTGAPLAGVHVSFAPEADFPRSRRTVTGADGRFAAHAWTEAAEHELTFVAPLPWSEGKLHARTLARGTLDARIELEIP